MSKFLDKTGLDTLWAKIKSTFQLLDNLVTSWGSTPSDTKYPSEKLVKTSLDSKVPGTTLVVSVPANSTRYVKMVVPYGYHHYLVFFNASQGILHAEWLFRTYGDGGTDRTTVNYIGGPVTARKWYVAGSSGNTFYIEFVNTSTASQSLNFKVCAIDISSLPTLTVESEVPSGYVEQGVVGTVASRLLSARNLSVSLSNTSTNTPFDGSANVTNIKTTGTLPVANGGTGKTSVTAGNYLVGNGTSALNERTPNAAANDLINALSTGTSTPTDSDYYVSQHAGGGTSNTTYYRRPVSALWEYIRGKISSVLGLTDTTYGGNAATATTAAGYTSGGAIDTALQGKQDDLHISSSGEANLFLNKQGSWAIPAGSSVTGVKGNAEASYRTGNVKLTSADIGIGTCHNISSNQALLLTIDGVTDYATIKCFASVGSVVTEFTVAFSVTENEGIYSFNIEPAVTMYACRQSGQTLGSSNYVPAVKYLATGDTLPKKIWVYFGSGSTKRIRWMAASQNYTSITSSVVDQSSIDSSATMIASSRYSYLPLVTGGFNATVGDPHTHVYVDASGILAVSQFSDLANRSLTTSGTAAFDRYKQDQVTYTIAFAINISEMVPGMPYRIWGGYRGAIVKNNTGSPVTVYKCGGTTFSLGDTFTFATHSTDNIHRGAALIVRLNDTNNAILYCPSY